MWFDTHAHLYDKTDQELKQCLENALENKGVTVINTSTNIQNARKVISQCNQHPSLFGAAGISPFDTENVPDNWENNLKELLRHEKIICVGETGLDNTNPVYPQFHKQAPVFEKQLDIAGYLDMPVVIHSRGAETETLNFCKNQNIKKVIFHCFSGNKNSLKKIIDAGYYVSFSGIITFKNSSIDHLVSFTPIDRMFIETDSPYLTPHPFRGKPNEPALVYLVGEKISEIKKISIEKTMERLLCNFSDLFNIPISGK